MRVFANVPANRRRNSDGGTDEKMGQDVCEESVFGLEDLLTLLHDLVYILAAVALVFTFCIRIVCVDGPSMLPTLHHGDRLLVLNNIWYSQPQRGDIVVARIPEFSSSPIVKRVIAVEGDVLDIDFSDGSVYINGQLLQETYILEQTWTDFDDMGIRFPVTIDEGCVFLMGDNRNDSYDSRYSLIGQVDTRYVLGRVIFLALPGGDDDIHVRDYSRIGSIE